MNSPDEPAPEVGVRPATAEDVEAISTVHGRSWQVGYAHIFEPEFLAGLDATRGQRVAFWTDFFVSGRERQGVVVATIGEAVVGFASYGPARLHRYHGEDGLEEAANPDEGRGELYAIYVDPEHWGAGAGHALMASVLSALVEEGFGEAVLWVLEDNPRALGFYARHGWLADGRSDLFERGGTVTTEIALQRTL